MKKLLSIIAVVLLSATMCGNGPKEYQSYVVSSGDTLYSIAKEITPNDKDYRKTVSYIISKNNIKDCLIYPGQVLDVPVID